MSEYTPGPWRWHHVSRRNITVLTNDMNAEPGEMPDKVIIDDGSCGEYNNVIDVDGPDAKLIEAAPDMLEALEVAQAAEEHYRFCEDCDQDDGLLCEEGEKLLAQAEELRLAAIRKAQVSLE